MAQFCLFFWLPIVTSVVAFHFVTLLLCNTLRHVRVGGFYFAFPARKHNRKFRKRAQVGQNLDIDVSEGTDISDGPAGRRWILLFVLFELNGLRINETKQNLLAGLWVSARSVTNSGPSRNTPMWFCHLKCTFTLFACVAREVELELNWSWTGVEPPMFVACINYNSSSSSSSLLITLSRDLERMFLSSRREGHVKVFGLRRNYSFICLLI